MKKDKIEKNDQSQQKSNTVKKSSYSKKKKVMSFSKPTNEKT